jgi:hypothetical protein
MGRVFISYRQQDSPGHARGLYDRLVKHFGPHQVFMDMGIHPGEDFPRRINKALARCDVLLAVIGRNWSDVRDGRGRLRLDDPNDYLRIEIETALRRRDVAVFPVLVAGARMPEEDELPGELCALASIQAHELADGRRWDGDVDFLADAVRRKLAAATAVAALLCALAAAALVLWAAHQAGLWVRDSWRAEKGSEEALLRLGVIHAAVWAIVAAAAAAAAAGAARGARSVVPAALLGALFGAVGGLLGGALDQALRASGKTEAGLAVGFALTGAIAAAGGLAGKAGAAGIAGAALGGGVGGLLAFGTDDKLLATSLPALLAVAGAGLAALAVCVFSDRELVLAGLRLRRLGAPGPT